MVCRAESKLVVVDRLMRSMEMDYCQWDLVVSSNRGGSPLSVESP